MFEGLVSEALTRVLGEYVLGLDKDKIQIGVWNGKLELKSLALHSEALSILFETLGINVPVTVLAGQIGTLNVEVPWKSLRSKPIRITLSDLSIVASPVKVSSQEAFRLRQNRLKSGKLAADDLVRESRWTEKTVSSSSAKSTRYSRLFGGVTSRLLSKVVDNIQIELCDVKIRFEDQTDPEKPFSIDIDLAALRLLSADSGWNVVYVEDNASEMLHKLIQLNGLAIRCGSLERIYNPEVHGTLRSQILYLAEPPEGAAELISPISGTVRATVRRASARALSSSEPEPDVKLEVFFPSMEMTMDHFQYSSFLKLTNELASSKKERSGIFPNDPQELWIWSLEKLLPGFTERRKTSALWTEQGVQAWSRRAIDYITSRIIVLKARRGGEESRADQDSKIAIELEHELSVLEITGFRDAVDAILEEEMKLQKVGGVESTPTAGQRFARFFKASAAIETAQVGAETEPVKSQDSFSAATDGSLSSQKSLSYAREVVEDLGGSDLEEEDDGGDENTEAPKMKLGILLESGSLNLVEQGQNGVGNSSIATLNLRQLRVGVTTRPLLGQVVTEILLGALELVGLDQKSKLLYSRSVKHTESSALEMRTAFPANVSEALQDLRTDSDDGRQQKRDLLAAVRLMKRSPGTESEDEAQGADPELKVEVAVSGLEAVVDGPKGSLISAAKFWKTRNQRVDAIMQVLGAAASERLKLLRMQLKKAMASKQIPIFLDISLRAPKILIPDRQSDDFALMVDLGKVGLETTGRCIRGSEALPYTEYVAAISDLSASLVDRRSSGNDSLRILEPVSIKSSVQVVEDESIPIDDPESTSRIRVLGVMPGIQITIAQDAYRRLLLLTRTWKQDLLASSEEDRESSAALEQVGKTGDHESEKDLEDGTHPDSNPVRRPRVGNDLDIRFALQEVVLKLTDKFENDIVQAAAYGSQIRVSASEQSTAVDFRLQLFEVMDFPGEPRRIVYSGSGNEDDDGDRKTFVHVRFKKDAQLLQDIKVKTRMLDCVVVNETILEVLRFLYVVKDGEGEERAEFDDPFAAAGTSAAAAAKLLREKAGVVIRRSRAVIQKLGSVKLQSEFDGLKILVTSKVTGDISSLEVRELFCSVNRGSSGDSNIEGRFGSISMKNLLTEFEEQRSFLEYTGGKNRSSKIGQNFGVSAFLPMPGNGEPSVTARFKALRIVFVQKFLFELETYFRSLAAECKTIVSKTNKVSTAEVFVKESSKMKKESNAPRKARVKLTTEGIEVTFPRHSKNNHEAVRALIRSISLDNDQPPSMGYNFAFNLNVDELNVYALYPMGSEKISFLEAAKQPHSTPIIDRLCINAKMDYWREGDKFEDIESAKMQKGDKALVESNPHHRLPAIRIRTAPVDGLDVLLCEAQYSILYFVFTENFIEHQAPSWDELMVQAEKNLAEDVVAHSNRLPPAMRLILNCPKVNLRLVANAEPNDLAKCIFEISARSLNMIFDFSSDSRIYFDIQTELERLVDRRTGRVSEVLASAMNENRAPQIHVTFDRPFLRRSHVMVVVSDVRLLILPEFIMVFTILALPGEPVVQTSLPGFEIPFCGRTVVVNLVQLEVLLFADTFERDDRCAVLRGDISMEINKTAYTGQTSLDIGSNSLGLAITEGKVREGEGRVRIRFPSEFETPLIFPTELLLELGPSGERVEDGQLLHLSSSDDITARLAVQDVKFVVDVVSRCLRMKKPKQDPTRPVIEVPESVETRALTFVLSLSKFRVLFTDEPGNLYIPIMEVLISRAALCSVAGSILKLSGELSADLYDPRKGWWVPGIEPWPMELAVSTGAESKSIMLHSADRLDLNATPVTIDGVMLVTRAIKQAIQSVGRETPEAVDKTRERVRRPESSAFVVRNESGMDITFWTNFSQTKNVLRSDEEKAVEMSRDDLVESSHSHEKLRKMRVFVSPSGFRPKELKLAEMRIDSVSFQPRGLELAWEVTMRSGIPLAIIRTSQRVVNHLSVPIEVRCGNNILRVESDGGHRSIPVQDLNQQIRIRPIPESDLEFEWSPPLWRRDQHTSANQKAQSMHRSQLQHLGKHASALDSASEVGSFSEATSWTLLRGGSALRDWGSRPGVAWQSITCHGRNLQNGQKLLPFSVHVDSDEGADRQWLDFNVRKPLILENALPRSLRVKLYSRDGNKASLVASYKMKPLDEVAVYGAGPTTQIYASVAYVNSVSGPADVYEFEDVISESFSSKFSLCEVGARDIPISLHEGRRENTYAARVELASSRSTLRACFFADLWLRNRSDVDLEIKAYGTETLDSGVVQLSASPPGLPASPFVCALGPSLAFRVNKSDRWSSLGGPAVELSRPMELEGMDDRSLLAKVKAARGGFQRTAVVTVRVALWLENLSGRALEWCHSSAIDKRGIVVTSAVNHVRQGEVAPLHFKKWGSDRSIRLRIVDADGQSDWIWSSPINADQGKGIAAKMYNPKVEEQYIARTRIVRLPGGSRKIVVYSEDREHPPFRMVNSCRYRSVAFAQASSNNLLWLIGPGSSSRYSWDDPMVTPRRRALQVSVVSDPGTSLEKQSESFEIGIDEVASHRHTFETTPPTSLYINISLDGPTKVVTFSDSPSDVLPLPAPGAAAAATKILEKPDSPASPVVVMGWDEFDGGKSVPTPRSPLTMAGARSAAVEEDGTDFAFGESEMKTETSIVETKNEPTEADPEIQRVLDVEILIDSIGVSMVDSRPEELLYLLVRNARLHIEKSPEQRTYGIQIQDLQIDNQLSQPKWPVVLWSPAPKEQKSSSSDLQKHGVTNAQRQIFEMNIVYGIDFRGISMIKAVYCAIQQLQLSVDEELVMRIWLLAQSFQDPAVRSAHEGLGADDGESRQLYSHANDEEKLLQCVYVETLLLAPVKITLNMASSRTPLPRRPGSYWGLIRTLIATFGNVENAEFRLNALQLRHTFDTKEDLLSLIGEFYAGQLNKQKLTLFTSNNLIGNPSVLFEHISTGAKDFFVEPYKVKSGAEFLPELYKGGTSLIGNTLGGIVGAVGSIPKALAGTMESAVSDRGYAATRSAIYGGSHRTTKNFRQGLARGAMSLGHGISSGVTGLFRDPYRGAIAAGPAGFFRGLGKGVVGGVLKPLTGALDLIAEPTIGLRSTIVTISRDFAAPSRPPRAFLGTDNVNRRLITYDFQQSLGSYIMTSLRRKKLTHETSKDLVGWVLLTADPSHGLASIWSAMSSSTRGVLGNRKHHDAGMPSGVQKPRVALVTKRHFYLLNMNLAVVWKCYVNDIMTVEGSPEDESVLLLCTKSRNVEDERRWTMIKCFTRENRDELYTLLNDQQEQQSSDPAGMESYDGEFEKRKSVKQLEEETRLIEESAKAAFEMYPMLKKDSSHRSIHLAVVNRSGEELRVDKSELSSGTWTLHPRDVLKNGEVDVFGAESGPGITADLHGAVVYTNGECLASLHFVNLFLAEKAYFGQINSSSSVFVTTLGNVDQEHAQITFAFKKKSVLPMAVGEVSSEEVMQEEEHVPSDEAGPSQDAGSQTKKPELEMNNEDEDDGNGLLQQLILLGFDKETANEALDQANGDMVAAVDILLAGRN
ncbi:hypothetical protein NDN08_003409 [Rhodosorus marinus]|uniref:UBA domain-containing protein n=1 Tax=Rhodosorus marinus TaxID=101924 RepID=A0AAV8UX36_9RHOD|nr:hypothetical protein NDN08_003409 [Rhodosorus marinus]